MVQRRERFGGLRFQGPQGNLGLERMLQKHVVRFLFTAYATQVSRAHRPAARRLAQLLQV